MKRATVAWLGRFDRRQPLGDSFVRDILDSDARLRAANRELRARLAGVRAVYGLIGWDGGEALKEVCRLTNPTRAALTPKRARAVRGGR